MNENLGKKLTEKTAIALGYAFASIVIYSPLLKVMIAHGRIDLSILVGLMELLALYRMAVNFGYAYRIIDAMIYRLEHESKQPVSTGECLDRIQNVLKKVHLPVKQH